MRRSLVIAGLLGACGADAPVLSPTVQVPPPESGAYPYTDLDELQLSVARAGDPDDLRLARFAPGETGGVDLTGVPFASELVVHLQGFTSGLEVAYGRTCRFDFLEGGDPPERALWFARVVKWSPGPAPEIPDRVDGLAFADERGAGVFVGGSAAGSAVDTVDRFDAELGAFAPLAATSAARVGSLLAQFPDRRALVVGGANAAGNAVPFYEVIDPDPALTPARQVVQVADDRLRLVDAALVMLTDGTILLVGGATQPVDDGPYEVTGETWRFLLGDGGVPQASRVATALLARPRQGHTATRLGDAVGAAVLVVGGRDALGPIGMAELYEPLRASYAEPPRFDRPSLLVPRYGHTAVALPDESVLIVGGRDAAGDPVAELELYRPLLGAFTTAGELPPGAGLTGFSVTPLPDGRVLITGGSDAGGEPVASAWIAAFDPIDDDVDLVVTDPLAAPRTGHAAVRLCDGTVLVVGGTSDPAAPPSERYNPPSSGRR